MFEFLIHLLRMILLTLTLLATGLFGWFILSLRNKESELILTLNAKQLIYIKISKGE